MNRDPIVEEIHQIRGRLLAECRDDLDKLLDRYQQSEKGDRVLTLNDVKALRRLAKEREMAE